MLKFKMPLKSIITLVLSCVLVIFVALWLHYRYLILFPFDTIERNLQRNHQSIKISDLDVKIKDNIKITDDYIFYQKNQKSNNNANQRILFFFSGNAVSNSEILSGFMKDADLNSEFKELSDVVYEKWLRIFYEYDGIVFIKYPIYAYSEGKVIDKAFCSLKSFIDNGYDLNNIDVFGHSIGGGVSAEVLRKLKIECNKKINNYINVNSFSNINRVLPNEGNLSDKTFLRDVLTFMSKVIFFGFHFNAEKVINDAENFGAQNITIIKVQNDRLIDDYASLYDKVQSTKVRKIENIRPQDAGNDEHNYINWTQIKEILSEKSPAKC